MRGLVIVIVVAVVIVIVIVIVFSSGGAFRALNLATGTGKCWQRLQPSRAAGSP